MSRIIYSLQTHVTDKFFTSFFPLIFSYCISSKKNADAPCVCVSCFWFFSHELRFYLLHKIFYPLCSFKTFNFSKQQDQKREREKQRRAHDHDDEVMVIIIIIIIGVRRRDNDNKFGIAIFFSLNTCRKLLIL